MRRFTNFHRVEPRQIYKMASAKGTTIHVRSGMAWLTEADVTDDHFLAGDQTYRIRNQGVVLIEPADMNAIEFEIERPIQLAFVRLACRAASGVRPVQRLKARWKALGSEKPIK